MRGKISDQDLTDYALNELQPEDRLYVESMLGVSESCREDVYRMLDLGEMLKEGLEMEEDPTFALDETQRNRVLDVPVWTWTGVIRRTAAVALLAAGVAFGFTRPGMWNQGGTVDKLADAGQAVQSLVGNIQLNDSSKSAEEFVARLKAAASAVAPAVEPTNGEFMLAKSECTPLPVAQMPAMPDIVEM
jgi:anti-sigma factor RsiW